MTFLFNNLYLGVGKRLPGLNLRGGILDLEERNQGHRGVELVNQWLKLLYQIPAEKKEVSSELF